MFGDEVGNQIEDGNNGVHRYISVQVTRTNLLPYEASGRFTLMWLTASTVDTVLCIFILAAKSLIFNDVKGFYYRPYIPYDSSKTME